MTLIDTTGFFTSRAPVWDSILRRFHVANYLEIGVCEGSSLFWLAERYASASLFSATAIDSWPDFHQEGFSRYELNFRRNLDAMVQRFGANLSVDVRKGDSRLELAKLIAEGRSRSYDLVYVDGSHAAPDVLFDGVLGLELLRVGGLIIFDDYSWCFGKSLTRTPKFAIDSVVNVCSDALRLVLCNNEQVFLRKTQDAVQEWG